MAMFKGGIEPARSGPKQAVAYVRVSTREQGHSGLGLEARAAPCGVTLC